MAKWDPRVGFEGTLHDLFALMYEFYPPIEAIAAVQRWLLGVAASECETFVCRKHDKLLPGEWVPGDGANPYLATDNELATSLYGLARSRNFAALTSKLTLLEALEIPGVRLCWGFGKTEADKARVLQSHRDGGISLPRRPSGTGLYAPRGKQVLKLAHLTPAAEGISAIALPEVERRRIRMFRSLNPLNMYPMPRAGNRFTHTAWHGRVALELKDKDLGETDQILQCLVALLEEAYDRDGEATTFADYARAARLDLAAMDLPALRATSREMHVAIKPKEHAGDGGSERGPETLSYEEFKTRARALVEEHGAGSRDRYVTGELCGDEIHPGPAPKFMVRFDGFDDDHADHNTVYKVAKDTRISALAYFLLLDERYGHDLMAIFRPGRSSTSASFKPFLNHEERDLNGVVPHLQLHGGEVKGWNVLAPP